MDTSFVYTTYINATPERLWTALTDPAFTKRYWGVTLASDWQVGSTVTWELEDVTIADDEQVVLAADPPRRLSYTWHTITPEFVAAFGDDQRSSWPRPRPNAARRSRSTSSPSATSSSSP